MVGWIDEDEVVGIARDAFRSSGVRLAYLPELLQL
jgi:hypothetical protein